MADKTAASIAVAADRSTIMAVISDFAAYPDWATGIRSAEVVDAAPVGGLPQRVRFALDAGLIKDSYVLAYDWQGDDGVRWELGEPGTMVTEMSGAYLLTDEGPGTRVRYELAVGTRMSLPGLLRRRAEKAIIDTALKGLRSRAETLHARNAADRASVGQTGRRRPGEGETDD
jgi:carbon monoxide dehydrogenase subunit G